MHGGEKCHAIQKSRLGEWFSTREKVLYTNKLLPEINYIVYYQTEL